MLEFADYHAKHPQIYEAFKKLTLETIAKGFKSYSSKGIFELIRWHTGTGAKKKRKIQDKQHIYPTLCKAFRTRTPRTQELFRVPQASKTS